MDKGYTLASVRYFYCRLRTDKESLYNILFPLDIHVFLQFGPKFDYDRVNLEIGFITCYLMLPYQTRYLTLNGQNIQISHIKCNKRTPNATNLTNTWTRNTVLVT